MAFWYSPVGKIDGNPEKAFAKKEFHPIPDNTIATAMIKSFTPAQRDNQKWYEITWKIVDGEHKNREIRQKLYCFDADDTKRFRALNTLRYLFNLLEVALLDDAEPTMKTLFEFQGKIAVIQIQEFLGSNNKIYNWVSKIYPTDFSVNKEDNSYHGDLNERKSNPMNVEIDDDLPF